jgi:hypothetical protein
MAVLFIILVALIGGLWQALRETSASKTKN